MIRVYSSYKKKKIENIKNIKRFLFFVTEQLGIFFNSDCKERNAECSKWDYFCVCHCDPGYFMYYGHCIKGEIKSITYFSNY